MLKSLLAGALLVALSPSLLAAPAKPAKPAKAKAAVAAVAPAAPLEETAELAQLRGAFQFAFPVYEMMRTRHYQVAKAESFGISGVNRLFARTTLADASSRDVTTPNNDTLYSSAWLDLAGGPVRLTLPPLPQRYHSAALIDLFTDNTSVIGTRTGAAGGDVLLAGPGWTGTAPDGVPVIRALTNDNWLLVRVVVNGPDDLAAAAAAANAFKVAAEPGNAAPLPAKTLPVAVPDAATLLAVVNEALGRGPLPADAAARAAKFADAGIVPGDTGAFAQLPPATQALWKAALPQLRSELKGGLGAGDPVDGWTYSPVNAGQFGDDDATRARVALGGLAALPRTEAMYLTAGTDAAGNPLDGSKSAYYLRLPGKMPIGAFWSLSVYQIEKDGRLFFVDTPSKRYAITDRTPYLHLDRDGSVEIFMQPGKPFGERGVNWLPVPAGPFVLIFRAYLPRAAMLDGSFKLPPVGVAEAIPTAEPKE